MAQTSDLSPVDPSVEQSLVRGVVNATVIRMALLPISGIASLTTAYIVRNHLGTSGFAVLTIISSIPMLLPVADLGVGASLTNAAAQLPNNQLAYSVLFVRAVRVLVASALVLVGGALLIAVVVGFPDLLSLPKRAGYNFAFVVAVASFAVALPASLGSRVLNGLGRNSEMVLIQGVGAPLTLMACALAAALNADLAVLSLTTFTGLLITNWWLLLRGMKLTGASLYSVARSAAKSSQVAKLRSTAAPMIVISLSIAVTFQTDRIVINFRAGLVAVAAYSAVSLVYLPLLSLVQTGGMTLWGAFARKQSTKSLSRRSFLETLLAMSTVGVVLALSLSILGPYISRWVVGPSVHLSQGLFLSFSLLLLIHAVHMPAAMLLTDVKGLRFQAIGCTAMALTSLGLSWLSVPWFGASGPVLASCAATLVCMLLPCLAKGLAALDA